MTPSAAKKKREQWRVNQRNRRERLKQINELMNDTPVSMNESNLEEPQPREPDDPQENLQPLASSSPERNGNVRTKNANKNKLKNEIVKLKRQLALSNKKNEKLRKRLQRVNKTRVVHVNEKRKSRGAKKFAAVKKAQVTHFLCRDENSRLLPGKKDTVTKKRESSKKSLTKTNERVTFTIQ